MRLPGHLFMFQTGKNPHTCLYADKHRHTTHTYARTHTNTCPVGSYLFVSSVMIAGICGTLFIFYIYSLMSSDPDWSFSVKMFHTDPWHLPFDRQSEVDSGYCHGDRGRICTEIIILMQCNSTIVQQLVVPGQTHWEREGGTECVGLCVLLKAFGNASWHHLVQQLVHI